MDIIVSWRDGGETRFKNATICKQTSSITSIAYAFDGREKQWNVIVEINIAATRTTSIWEEIKEKKGKNK